MNMWLKQILITLCALGMVPMSTVAQGLINIRHYSVKDGLSQNTVQSVLQDKDGYIWLATWNGLEKFDGYTFKNYKTYPTDKVKLKYNRLLKLVQGGNHTLLCESYDNRIYLFDIQEEIFEDIFSYHPGIKVCEHVSDMVALPNGVVWVINRQEELWRIDTNRYKEKDGVVYLGNRLKYKIGNRFFSVVQDDAHGEWIFTDQGYFVYGNAEISGNVSFRFTALMNGRLFIANTGERLMSYTPETGLQSLQLSYPVRRIRQLLALKDGRLAVFMERAILIYNPENESCELLELDDKQENLNPDYVYQSSDGTIWCLNSQGHILKCDIYHPKIVFLDYPKSEFRGMCFIHEDESGNIWAYPSDGFLSYYNPQKETFELAYTLDKGNKSMYVEPSRTFFIDYHKNIWLCREFGVDRIAFSDKNYDYIRSTDGVGVRGLFIDSRQRIWVSARDGIVQVYDKERHYCGNLRRDGQLVKDPSVKFGANVYAFLEDKYRRLWIGTRNNGLFVGIPEGEGYRLTQYKSDENKQSSINSNSVFSIIEDRHGHIWIGTYGGGLNLAIGAGANLCFVNPDNQLKNYPQEACKRVRTVCSLSNGMILVGTTDGLLSFSSEFGNPEDVCFYHNSSEAVRPNSLSDNDVMHIMESSAGKIYITTYGGGISQIQSSNLLSDELSFFHYNKKNGLPSDMAFAVTEDNERQLWITFESFICKFVPDGPNFEAYDDFNTNTDLILTELPPVIDSAGNMYLGCSEGALRVDLKRLKKSLYTPNLVFTGVDIQRRGGISTQHSIVNDTLILQKEERSITVSFAALDFTKPANLKYAYRIPELSDDWIYIGNNRSATLANLPAGDIGLEVKSTNSDGVWVDNVRVLYIKVQPTFWETGWAWLFYFVLFLIALTFVSGIIIYIWGLRKKINFEKQLTNMKLRFFTDVSHELRTPLILIEGPIEEVLKQEQLSPGGTVNMQVAKRNTERMLQLINQLLDFRKIQNHKMKLYIEQADIVPLSRKVYESFAVMANQSGIDFRFVAHEENINIYTDLDKFEKIIFNLLSNAFKYTPRGKSISLIIELQADVVLVQVKDEGKGIDYHKLGKLFDRFETLGSTQSSLSTGIGLSLVKDLVELMHGKINVNTTLGEGSTFIVSLPLSVDVYRNDSNAEFVLDDGKCSLPATETIATEEVEQKSFTVLVVEDNDELRHFIVHILQKEYHVLEAENGKAGLEKVIAEIPDIVVSDVMMPEMDGITLLNSIKNNHSISHIPIILLSARASLEDRIQGLEYGADEYITKPFSSAYLRAKLKSLLQQRAFLKDYLLAGKKFPVGHSSGQEKTIELGDLSPSLPQITHFDEEFISKVIQNVESNLANPDFRMEDLSDSIGMGRTMFYRKIKSLLGVSPIDFVKDMRIKRSVQLLDSGEYTVSEIAYMCGFSSPQYFSRVFKTTMNCTPTEYKDQICQ